MLTVFRIMSQGGKKSKELGKYSVFSYAESERKGKGKRKRSWRKRKIDNKASINHKSAPRNYITRERRLKSEGRVEASTL